jgi:cytochrome subunit of sulfide dehydrogenase
MQEFRDGRRPSTVMQQLARGYSDEDVSLIAAWLAARKPEHP